MNEHPHIIPNVPGPLGARGALLIAPRNEAMEWDLRHEIASTSRYWLRDRQAWWVAEPYVPTLRTILARFEPAAEAAPAAPGRVVEVVAATVRVEAAPAPAGRPLRPLAAALARVLGFPWRRRGPTALAR